MKYRAESQTPWVDYTTSKAPPTGSQSAGAPDPHTDDVYTGFTVRLDKQSDTVCDVPRYMNVS